MTGVETCVLPIWEAGPISFTTGPQWIGGKTGDGVRLDVTDEGVNAQPVLIKRVEIDPATTKVRFEAETETSSKHAFALGQTTTPPPPVTLTAPDMKPPAPLVGLWDVEIGRASCREKVYKYV